MIPIYMLLLQQSSQKNGNLKKKQLTNRSSLLWIRYLSIFLVILQIKSLIRIGGFEPRLEPVEFSKPMCEIYFAISQEIYGEAEHREEICEAIQ